MRILINDEAFERELKHHEELMKLFKPKYGNWPLEKFEVASYKENIASIKFDYWT